MAKADNSTAIDCSAADAMQWSAEVLRMRFAEILNFSAAALISNDIEAVHDIRVATRRLRSAIRDFVPLTGKNSFRRLQKDLKDIADALGTARDQDVAIAALEKLQTKSDEAVIKEDIGKLIEERRAIREKAQTVLTQTLTGDDLNKLETRFAAAIDKALEKKAAAETVTVSATGRAVMLARLKEFCDLSAALYTPFGIRRLHRLRISAKRLRYAIELFVVCWQEQIVPFAREIAEMQTFLGELHDADVWIENVSKRLRKSETESPADLWLLSEFVKDRTKNYRGALNLWSKWKTERFFEKLRELISK